MSETVCWIDDIDYPHANPMLRSIYHQVSGADGQLDNLYRGFSQSPQTILPADTLYKAAMHHSNNRLPKVFSELIGTYVAILTGCDYALAHHGHNYLALSANATIAQHVIDSLQKQNIHSDIAADDTGENASLNACGNTREVAALRYVRKLTLHPERIIREDIVTLQTSGWDDTEISEIAQVAAMFSYFVRIINGVGIQLGDEKLGLYS